MKNMAVKIDQRYEANVIGALFTEAETGTPAFALTFMTSDGDITHKFWISDGTIERLVVNFEECFGISDERLFSKEFRDNMGTVLKNRPVSITTEAAKDRNQNVLLNKNGDPYAAVKWMNPSRMGKQASRAAGDRMDQMAARRFGGSTPSNDPPGNQWDGTENSSAPASRVPDDDDVPF
jgi:hypothetical protein